MADGNYIVMRNSGNTDAVPNNGSGSLTTLWDQEVALIGSTMSYASGTFTLGEIGLYLIFYSDQYGTTNQTNNQRFNVRSRLELAGTLINDGRSSGYIRKNNTGSSEYIASGFAIIEVTTTTGNGDEIKIIHDRLDDSTSGTCNRIANRSGVTIIKLADDEAYGMYVTTGNKATPTGDGTAADIAWDSNDRQDTGFSRSGDVVTLADPDRYLVTYTIPLDGSPGTGRGEYTAHLEIDSVVIPGTTTQTYVRTSDVCDDGCLSWAGMIDVVAGDITLVITRRDGANATVNYLAGTCIQMLKLVSGTETCRVEATSGETNGAATDFAWDTNPQIDGIYTHTVGTAPVQVDTPGDFLCFVSMARTSLAAVTRAVPAVGFRVNTSNLHVAGSSSYNRNAGAGFSALNMAGLLTTLADGDDIIARVDRIGTASGAVACQTGQMVIIRLGSIFDEGGG